jgi:hypothetical protein
MSKVSIYNSIINPYAERNISFQNDKGDIFSITADELKNELSKFIDLQYSSMTYDKIELRKEYLKKELDKKLNEFELSLRQHIDNKLNKITEKIIDNITDRVFEDRVKREVKERLKNLEL